MTTNTATSFAAFNAEQRVSFIQKYNSKAMPSAGMRIIAQSYRGDDKKGVIARPAVMMEVPAIELIKHEFNGITVYASLPQSCIDLLTDQYEAGLKLALKDGDLNGRTTVDWEACTPEACWERLTAASETIRLSKELIEAWFASIESVVAERGIERAIAAGYSEGSTEYLATVAKTINAYRTLYLLPAASVWTADRSNVEAGLDMLQKVDGSHPVARSLRKRMVEFLTPSKVTATLDAL